MKTVKIVLALLAAVVIFNSCTKEYAVPTITWTPDNLSQFVDFEDETTWNQTLNITFGAEAGISEIKIWKHVYTAAEIDPTTTLLDAPTGYDALTTFAYAFTTTHAAADFAGGVTKIVYEFEVTDASETPQTTAKEYTFFSEDVYSVTINVEDEQGVAIEDATVTFNGVEKTAAPYVFNYIPVDNYEYTVEKAGYTTVNVTDFAVDSDTTITVEMIKNLSAWSSDVMISLLDNAYYNHIAVPDHENTTIGFSYYTNPVTPANHAQVKKTANCTGWVEVTVDNYTTQAELAAAYEAGTEISEAFLGFDYEAKTFAGKIFISKIGDEYVLVKYIAGLTCPNDHTSTTGNKGNVLVFQYKK
ncbi:MAG: carboxypeptidase-like regulatory domain-containing protein [Bacteroidales bacterium]|nr:carboxypeptidase-like regulatory domain-containing protein [Bacteroidales bacterium]